MGFNVILVVYNIIIVSLELIIEWNPSYCIDQIV